MPTFYSIQLPIRRKVHICCMFTVGGAAVTLGFVRMRSLRILNSGTNTSDAVGEMMIVGALGMSLAAIAHNLPSMRVFWTHISNSRSKAQGMWQRPCAIKSKDELQSITMYGLHSAVYGLGSFQRPMLPAVSVTSLVDRPLPALPNGARQPRYPIVNDDFGLRPRTPPSIV